MFAAFTQTESLDMRVLGRDILNLFALIVDRPRDVVCLLGDAIAMRLNTANLLANRLSKSLLHLFNISL